MTKDEALRLALEALENLGNHDRVCPQWPTYAEPENYPKCNCGYDQSITAIKAALEAKDEPVVWGASSISKPEYIAEQKAKTKELRNMMDKSVQTVPNFDQLQQIFNNLERCLTRDSKHEFLRVWIRDWTEHKLSKHTSAAQEAKDEFVCVCGAVWEGQELVIAPSQRTWVGLTNKQLLQACQMAEDGNYMVAFQRIQQWLKEKNK